MSTIKVNRIENTSTTDGGVSIDVDGHVTIDGQQLPTAGPLSNRNRIINGDMRIDQRNAGASVTPADGNYTLDRWRAGASAASKFSVQQSSIAPTGFNFSMLCTSLSAYSVGTNDNFEMMQYIEGFNAADFGWGTANAQTVTLSFWVRSSLTGTFGGSINNSAFNRSYPFSYTISVADTWEYKTITIAGDTSGTWVGATNGIGIVVCIGLGAGTGRSGTAGSWSGSTFYNATGATSVVGTNGATFYITGVQLEVGSKATPFEHESYGQTLAKCQRYYFRINGSDNINGLWGTGFAYSSDQAVISVPTPVTLRAAPTAIEQSGTAADYRILESGNTVTCTAVPAYGDDTTNNVVVAAFSTGNLTAGQGVMGRWNTGGNGYLAWSVEL